MHASAEAAIGAGEHVFPPDDVGEADQPVGDQVRMLDHVGRVTDDARYQQLPIR